MGGMKRAFDNLRLAVVTDDNFPGSETLMSAIGDQGGDPIEFKLETSSSINQETAELANRILTADIEVVVFVTSVGVHYLIEQASKSVDRQRFVDCLSDTATVAGSEKAAEALLQYGIKPALAIDTAGSWRDILMSIDKNLRIANQAVGLEESGDLYGLASGLEARGARVTRIPIYAQEPPAKIEATISFFEQIEAHDFHAVVFSTPSAAARYCYLSKQFGRARLASHLLDNHIVLTLNPETKELLLDRGIAVDFAADQTEVLAAVDQFVDTIEHIKKQKNIIRVNMSGPASSNSDQNAPWYDSPFMKACRGEPTDVTPIWMMRQAGRYMAEYRDVRSKVSFLELCANPQLCSEVMCTAVNRLGVDAAIIFSDLLPILVPMGCDLEFVKGDGPVIHNPVRTTADVDRIQRLESNDELQFVMDTVRQTRNDLPADMPLIGFAGSPFTLASYMIEGGSSKTYHNTKAMMFGDSGSWKKLMDDLSHSIALYLNGQIEAGAQCVQLFDSWAGCLSFEAYREHVHPYVRKIIASLPSNVPVINFATGNPALLPLLADTRAAVVGIDWRTRLDDAWQTVGYDRAVQGNLDPTVLLTNPKEIKRHAKIVLDQAAGRPGHIFNLGHGIMPMTPVDNAIALVDAVHELSQK
jgi:uroporphyrinogen decarboxylase